MAWLAVDKNGQEYLYKYLPIRIVEDEDVAFWLPSSYLEKPEKLPNGTIEKLIGKKLTWEDNPYQININKHDSTRTKR